MTGTLRPLPGQDARAWTAAVFAAGDYAGAAMHGEGSTWQFHAARALLRGDEYSFAALRQFTGAEPAFHGAAARWIHGDEARARQELAGLRLPAADNLLRLLDRDRIRVLAQLPWSPGAMTDLLGGARHDRRFEVRSIGHRAGDLANPPYADATQWLADGFAPDFYVAAMVEWHHLPPNLQALACPLFGHLADHDLHIQSIRPWLDLFDELCVTDRTEWLDVQGLGRGAVVTSFPKVFGLPTSLSPLPTGDRHLDFFVSGTMLDPYHPDKAKALHELLAMPDIALRVVRGFTAPLAFHALLAASKASFTFVRRPGAMPTRGLESLALGCAVALQRESILNLWIGRDEGAATYGANPGELAAAVRNILDDWAHFGPAARPRAAPGRAHVAVAPVGAQYLRFLTFRASLPRAARRPVETASWCQKRVCVSRTWLPEDPMVRRRTMQANFRRLGQRIESAPDAATIVVMARELLCEHAFYRQRDLVEVDEQSFHDAAIRLLEKCCRMFPDHLVARFLLVRALWHHGDAAARERALMMAQEALELPAERWQVGPDDDVMPFDFHADCFNYRDYLDLVAKACKGGRVATAGYVRLIRAALAGYLARERDELRWHELAATQDPGFARYRLDLARCLLQRGDDPDRARALLLELAAGSTEFAAAAAAVRRHWPERAAALLGEASSRALQRIDADTIDTGIGVAAMFAVERRAAPAPRPAPRARIAVAVPVAGSERELGALLADLQGQTAAAELVVAVAVPRGAAGLLALVQATTTPRCQVVAIDAEAAWSERLNACLQAAPGPLVTVAMTGDRFRADAYERMADELERQPAAALTFANEGWTEQDPVHFEPSACGWFTCPPPNAHRRLATSAGVGRHAMWRRSLHEQHGWFDAGFGAAAEYEFWLRATRHREVRQLPLLLTISGRHSPGWAHRDPANDRAAVARAQQLHLGADGAAFVPLPLLPAALLSAGIREEATSHARLGVIADVDRRELGSLESFVGTALLHGDFDTAICMLRAAITSAPSLLAPRLALVELAATRGVDARDILREASACHPYAAVIDRRLAAMRAAPVVVIPEHAPRPPVSSPC
jgi:hypothetical protein